MTENSNVLEERLISYHLLDDEMLLIKRSIYRQDSEIIEEILSYRKMKKEEERKFILKMKQADIELAKTINAGNWLILLLITLIY